MSRVIIYESELGICFNFISNNNLYIQFFFCIGRKYPTLALIIFLIPEKIISRNFCVISYILCAHSSNLEEKRNIFLRNKYNISFILTFFFLLVLCFLCHQDVKVHGSQFVIYIISCK